MGYEMNKFYMNNPCQIIREIGDDFSEIVVFPEFADSFEGSQWCTECMAGTGYSSHTCAEFEEVIEAIRDTQASMLVMAENRLIQDAPVEFAKWSRAVDELKKTQSKTKEERLDQSKIKSKSTDLFNRNVISSDRLMSKASQIEKMNESVGQLEREIYELRSSVNNSKGLVSVGGVTLSMSVQELKEMISKSLKMERLEAGKVDNWEWYDDALEGFNEDLETDRYISELKIESIQ